MTVYEFDAALVRSPGESAVDGLRASGGRAPSLHALRTAHRAYVRALREAGVEVDVLPALEAWPDSMFIEDPALVFSEGAILLRCGAPSRAGEAEELESELRKRFDQVLTLDEGTADGGDALVTAETVFIGLSGRTDPAGARALSALLVRLGREARIVETPPGTLRLKSGASLLDEETLVVTPSLAASGIFEGFRLFVVPEDEQGGANLLRINDRVLAGAEYPRTLEMLDRFGLEIVPLPVAEIAKLDAGLSCMSLRWRR